MQADYIYIHNFLSLPEFPEGYFESKTDLILDLFKCYLPNFIIYPQVNIKNLGAHISWNFSLKSPGGNRGYCYAYYWLLSKRLEFYYVIDKEKVEVDSLFLDNDL